MLTINPICKMATMFPPIILSESPILKPVSEIHQIHIEKTEASNGNIALIYHVNPIALMALVGGGTRMGFSEERREWVNKFHQENADVIDSWKELKCHKADNQNQKFCNHIFLAVVCRFQMSGSDRSILEQVVRVFEIGIMGEEDRIPGMEDILFLRSMKYSNFADNIRRRTRNQNEFFNQAEKALKILLMQEK